MLVSSEGTTLLPVWGCVRKAPELRRGAFEAKAHFCSTALPLTQVNDPTTQFLAVGDISQNKPFAQSDGLRHSNETTMSTKYDSTRGICEGKSV